jgi:hypothetical protein
MVKSLRALVSDKLFQACVVRGLLYAAIFAYILPAAFALFGASASFSFAGGIGAALLYGFGFVGALFAATVVIAVAYAPFKLTEAQRKRLWPVSGTLLFLASAFIPFGAVAVGLGVTVHGLLAAIVSGAVSTGIMVATLPMTGSAGK